MGRHRTPTELLKLRGTFRPDRHGDKGDTVTATGSPDKPDWLNADPWAGWAWDTVVGSLPPGVLASLDVLILAGACRWWSLWFRWDLELAKGEGDGYKLTIQVGLAWRNFERAASKLGLSPADRAKLTIPPAELPLSLVPSRDLGKERFFRARG